MHAQHNFLLWEGADLELDFGGGLTCLFRVRSFQQLLFAVGKIAIWGAMVPLDLPLAIGDTIIWGHGPMGHWICQ